MTNEATWISLDTLTRRTFSDACSEAMAYRGELPASIVAVATEDLLGAIAEYDGNEESVDWLCICAESLLNEGLVTDAMLVDLRDGTYSLKA